MDEPASREGTPVFFCKDFIAPRLYLRYNELA